MTSTCHIRECSIGENCGCSGFHTEQASSTSANRKEHRFRCTNQCMADKLSDRKKDLLSSLSLRNDQF